MMEYTRLKDSIDEESKRLPLTYYLLLVALVLGIIWTLIPGILVLVQAQGQTWGFKEYVSLLFFLLVIPEGITLYLYARRHAAAIDVLNISFAAASLLCILTGHWVWILIILVFWYVLSDFIRFRQHNGKFVFRES